MPPSLSASTLCCRYRSCSPAFLLCCCSVPHNPRCRTADLIIFDELQKPSHTVVHLPLSADMCTASRFPPDLCALHDPFIIPSIFTIEEVVIHLHCPSIHPVDSGFNSMLFTSPCDYIPIRIMMLHQPPTIAPCHPLGHGHLPLLVDSFLGCTGSTQLSLASAHIPHTRRSRVLVAVVGLSNSVGANHSLLHLSAHSSSPMCPWISLSQRVKAILVTGDPR